jgi:hypothetical protein
MDLLMNQEYLETIPADTIYQVISRALGPEFRERVIYPSEPADEEDLSRIIERLVELVGNPAMVRIVWDAQGRLNWWQAYLNNNQARELYAMPEVIY